MQETPVTTFESPITDTSKWHIPTIRPRIPRKSLFRELLDLGVLVLAIYALVNLSSVRFIVDGPSMLPNFESGQFLIVSRASYLIGEPQRGDIVVFHYPGDPHEDYIKRLIGMPGETVEIRDTVVYINGVALVEPYINEPCTLALCPDEEWVLANDEYFFLGDNRNHSSDSRRFGPVHRRYVVGRVLVRYWPPQDWAILPATLTITLGNDVE